jgi:hypothetical protein
MSTDLTVAKHGRDFHHLIEEITHQRNTHSTQVLFKCTNGWSASVIRGAHTIGGHDGLFELAVVGPGGDLNYRNPITGRDVIGYLSGTQVVKKLRRLANLTSEQLAAYDKLKKWEYRMQNVRELKETLVYLYAEETGIVFTEDDVPTEVQEAFSAIDALFPSKRPEDPEIIPDDDAC